VAYKNKSNNSTIIIMSYAATCTCQDDISIVIVCKETMICSQCAIIDVSDIEIVH